MTEPTRLLLIQGDRMAMYNGTQRASLWETGDATHPIDGAYYDELMPVVYDEAWFVRESQRGRHFSVMLLQGEIMDLQVRLRHVGPPPAW